MQTYFADLLVFFGIRLDFSALEKGSLSRVERSGKRKNL